MRTLSLSVRITYLTVALSLILGFGPAHANEEKELAFTRKLSCAELVEGYKALLTAEQDVIVAMKKATKDTVATNLFGIATLATLGLGFFTYNDSQPAEENLAEIHADVQVVKAVAKEKSCILP